MKRFGKSHFELQDDPPGTGHHLAASARYGGYSRSDSVTEGYTKIEISLRCRKLKKMDLFSRTDAFCVLHLTDPEGGPSASVRGSHLTKLPSERSIEIGRTEVVYDTQNPDFSKTFLTNFVFAEQQTLLIRVYDEDKKGVTDLKKHDFVGSASVTLAELMSAKGNTVQLPLEKKGFVIVQAEEVRQSNDQLGLQFSGTDLKNCDTFGKSDPFYTISRMNENGEYTQIYKSKVIMNDLNPQWKATKLRLQTVCNGDIDRPIKIHICDWDSDGRHDDMGSVNTTVRNLLKTYSYDVMLKGKQEGKLIVNRAVLAKVPSMLEYTSGICEIHFMAAIDFTSSNGEHTSPDSLHFIDHRGFPNEYQAALSTIGKIMHDWGAIKKEGPLWGFGAKKGSKTEHFFHVEDEQNIGGINGMLDAYKNIFSINGFAMNEPTLLAPLVRAATNQAILRSQGNEQAYSVLLILTDGQINDVDATIDEVCAASKAPLSIVIVGVGDGNFSDMERLDADETRLVSSSGIQCERDIVQFVPFRRYSKNISRLAAETLSEIPDQLVQYFFSKGIMPTPKQVAPQDQFEIEFDPTISDKDGES